MNIKTIFIQIFILFIQKSFGASEIFSIKNFYINVDKVNLNKEFSNELESRVDEIKPSFKLIDRIQIEDLNETTTITSTTKSNTLPPLAVTSTTKSGGPLVASDLLRSGSKTIAEHPSWKYILDENEECGESNSDRIIGGVNAGLGQFPWIAHLGYKKNNNEKLTFKCGGTLISSIYVVTAAHCVISNPMFTLAVVRLGEHDTKSVIDCVNDICAKPVQDLVPIKTIIHENYDQALFINDIALLRLDKKVDYNGWVSPICLPQTDIEALNQDTMFEVAGWGYTSMKTMNTATILQTIKLPIISREICRKNFTGIMKIEQQHICAGGLLNEDACGGDSGGPLMKVTVENGHPQYLLVGVVSFGPSDCGNTEPGVYANVYHFIKWILDNIEP